MGSSCSRFYLCINDATCAQLCTRDGEKWRTSIEKTDGALLFCTTVLPWVFHCNSCQIIGIHHKDKWYVILASCITCPVPCIMLPFFRKWTRDEYGIDGGFCNDFAQSWLCYPCTLQVINDTLGLNNYQGMTRNSVSNAPKITNSMPGNTKILVNDLPFP